MKIEVGKKYLFDGGNHTSLFGWYGNRKISVTVVDLQGAGPLCPGVITEDRGVLEHKRITGLPNTCWYVNARCLTPAIITDISQMDIDP